MGIAVPPSPPSTSDAVRASMQSNRRQGTRPEARLRSRLHSRGWRFRKDYRIDLPGKPARPDVAFTKRRVAVFVDGCFWHGCPEHFVPPKSNTDYWQPKIARNIERDKQANEALNDAGWAVIRVWEHEDLDDAVDRIESILRAIQASGQTDQNA